MPDMTTTYKFPYPRLDESVDPSRDIRALAEAIEAIMTGPMPVGAIAAINGTVAPAGWAMCDGAPHGSPALQAVLGSPNTPDMRGRFLRGAGGAVGLNTTGGAETITLGDANMPPHSHTASFPGAGAVGGHTHSPTFPGAGTSNDGGHFHTPAGGTGQSFLTIAPPSNTLGSLTKGTAANVSSAKVPSGNPVGARQTNATGGHDHNGAANVGFSAAGGSHAHGIPAIGAASGANPVYNNMPAFTAMNFIIRTVL